MALGTLTLSSNTSGTDNTAIGNLALQNSVNTSDHVCCRQTGRLWDHRPSMIILSSATTLVCTVALARKVTVCYIDNIYGANVDDTDGIPVSCSSIPMEGWAQCPLPAGEFPVNLWRPASKPFPMPLSKPSLI